MRRYSSPIVILALLSLALNSGCASSPPKQPEVKVLAVQPTAPRLPAALRTPAPTNYDQRIEYSLETYYKSLGTRSKLLKSETGLPTNTLPTANENDRASK